MTLLPRLLMFSFSFAGCSVLLPLAFRSVVAFSNDVLPALLLRLSKSSDFLPPSKLVRPPLTLRPIAPTRSVPITYMLCGRLDSVGLSCAFSRPPLKFRCLDGEYSCGVYFAISSFTLTPDLIPSFEVGLEPESCCLAVLAYCAHIGDAMAELLFPLEEDGGVVFSLSFGAEGCEERSLFDRFILANMPARLVEDLDFLGEVDPSCPGFFVGNWKVLRS